MSEVVPINHKPQPPVNAVALIPPWGAAPILLSDVDALIAAYERADKVYCQARLFRQDIAYALLANTGETSEGRTRYVRGTARRAKVELADDAWDQKVLMRAWETWPQYARDVLRIERLRVMKRELAKVEKESGPPEFMAFRETMTKANLGPTGTPRICPMGKEDADVQAGE